LRYYNPLRIVRPIHTPTSPSVGGTAIAKKYRDKMKRNRSHVCKAKGMVTPVNPGKQTIPTTVHSHRSIIINQKDIESMKLPAVIIPVANHCRGRILDKSEERKIIRASAVFAQFCPLQSGHLLGRLSPRF